MEGKRREGDGGGPLLFKAMEIISAQPFGDPEEEEGQVAALSFPFAGFQHYFATRVPPDHDAPAPPLS